jgi:alpha-mannosidase II
MLSPRLGFFLSLLVLSFIHVSVGIFSAEDLEVFILPHSHIDQGWLRTVGEYRDETFGIINSVINSLLTHRHHKYIWGDVLYFKDWFEGQQAEMQQKVRELINTGRFEIVGGGWIQNDEACPSAQAIINQMTLGHEYLLSRFNVRPKVAWQIDPFGHEGRIPTLYADMGFDAIVINRVHHKIKAQMKIEKALEFIWKPKSSAVPTTTYRNESNGLMTHVLHTHYSAPQGFDFENHGVLGVSSSNVAERAKEFVAEMKKRASHYRTNHILVPFGDDFKFKDANRQFGNMDQLIEYINNNVGGVKIKYATATEYFESLYEYQSKNKIDFPVVDHDFVPYADNEDSYWTGYYTSLPNLKKRAREAEAALQNAENAFILAKLYRSPRVDNLDWQGLYARLQIAREDTALVNHHDGITGTCRNHVYHDYMGRLANSISASKDIERQLLTIVLASDSDEPFIDAQGIIEEPTDIIVHNSEGHVRNDLVSIRTHSANPIVTDLSTGKTVDTMVIANINGKDYRLANSGAEHNYMWVHFFVNVNALGIKKYRVHFEGQDTTAKSTLSCNNCDITRDGVSRISLGNTAQIENSYYILKIGSDGYIESITDKKNSRQHKYNKQFFEYKTQRSGSYIFRPEGEGPNEVTDNTVTAIYTTPGKLFSQIIVVGSRFTTTYRLYREWIDTRFDIQSLSGDTELTTRFYNGDDDSGDKSKLIVYDGLNFVKRVVHKEAPHAGHYYPSPAGAIYMDSTSQLTVLTAQTMAVTKDRNALQFMIHRRLQRDDGRGMSQANNDDSPLYGLRFMITYQDVKQSSRFVDLARQSIDINRPISLSFGKSGNSVESVSPVTNSKDDLEIISFQSRDLHSDDIVLRVRNLNPSKVQQYHPNNAFRGTLESIRAKSLSLAFDVPNSARSIHPYRMQFRAAGKLSFDFTLASATIEKDGANQNTNEEGVFLSDEALAEAKMNINRKLQGLEDLVYKMEPFEIRTFIVDLELEPLKRSGKILEIPPKRQPIPPKKDKSLPLADNGEKPTIAKDKAPPLVGDGDSHPEQGNIKDEEYVAIDEILGNRDQNEPLRPHSLIADEEIHLWSLYGLVLMLSVFGCCSLTFCYRKGSKKILNRIMHVTTPSKESTILPYEVVDTNNNSKEH